MIEKKNRVPLGNQKNNIIRANLSPVLSAAELIAALNSGIYADISANDAVSGDNVGTIEVGTKQTKALWDEILAASGTTSGTSSALTLTQTGFVLADGAAVRFKLGTAMDKGATLNVNGTGAHAIVDALGKPQKAIAGSYCTVIYSSTTGNFILQGSGGAVSRFGNDVGQISTFEWMIMGNFSPYYGR